MSMHRAAWCAVAAALAACAAEPGDSTDTAGATAAGAPAARSDTSGAGPDTTPREIYIDSVVPGNPLVVRGRARTFENTVQVRASDTAGATITEVYETSVGEMGNHNPFEARVWLVRDPGDFVTVGAFEYSAKDGSIRSLVERRVPLPGPRANVTVAFATSDCTVTRPFERRVPRSVGIAQLLVHILIAGPTDAEKAKGAAAVFPPGSRLNSVAVRDGIVTVDFDDRLRNVGGSCAAQAIRASVTETLMRLPGVRHVVITAAGSEEQALQP